MRLPAVFAVFLSLSVLAADRPLTEKAIFTISGLECGSCVYVVQTQLNQTRGIAEVEVLQHAGGFARVSYDPRVVSEHQIAQSVRDTSALHGMPYIASMKLRVHGFSKHSGAVKALFEAWKPLITLEILDEREGELTVNFSELERDNRFILPRGWSLSQLQAGLKEFGLAFQILSPDQL